MGNVCFSIRGGVSYLVTRFLYLIHTRVRVNGRLIRGIGRLRFIISRNEGGPAGVAPELMDGRFTLLVDDLGLGDPPGRRGHLRERLQCPDLESGSRLLVVR